MSGEENELQIKQDEGLEGEVSDHVDPPADRLGTEGRQGLVDPTEQVRHRSEQSKPGGRSGITGEFGKVDFFESTPKDQRQKSPSDIVVSAPLGDGPGQNDGDVDFLRSADATAKDKLFALAAAEFEKNARSGLSDEIKGMKFTTNSSRPRVVEIEEKFTVSSEKSALELAEERLGKTASDEQKAHYALVLLATNHRETDDLDRKLPPGTVLKMPGQTSDGGVTHREARTGAMVTEWHNLSKLRVELDGSGSAEFNTADGSQVSVSWDPRDGEGTVEKRSNHRALTTTDSLGVSKKRIIDEATGDDVGLQVSRTDEKGRKFVEHFRPEEQKPHLVTLTYRNGSTVEMTPGNNGDFVSADGRKGMDKDRNLYTLKPNLDGSITRTYETGLQRTLDAQGHTLKVSSKDAWGRSYTYLYNSPDVAPHTIVVKSKEDKAPVELRRDNSGKYSGDLLDAHKVKIGSVEYGPDGHLMFKNDRDGTAHTRLKDGTYCEKKREGDGSLTVMSKNGQRQLTHWNANGVRTSETSVTADGREYTRNFFGDGKQLKSITIRNSDDSMTEMVFDPDSRQFNGTRKNKAGAVLEKVTMLEDKLVYTDVKTGAVRAEIKTKHSEENLVGTFIPGKYDRNTGTFTYKGKDGSTTMESFAPGRIDTVHRTGAIEGSTVRGDKSSLKPSGEAVVQHSDGTGVRLNPDLTIDRWGPEASDTAPGEKLSPAEEKFVTTHADIDRRHVAEIHRRLRGDHAKLDSFYSSLDKIESANNLSDVEKAALRKDLMHHVAFPEEIYQGRSPSCNVSVIQRDIAMTNPTKYVDTVVKAVSDGFLATHDGTTVLLDPKNLKMQDSSGRDLASRIFQTAAIQIAWHPHRQFLNHEDGIGRLYEDWYDRPSTFTGLNAARLAEARYRLTGEEKGIVGVATTEDLLAAFEANGGQPMIAMVDGLGDPFGGGGPVGAEGKSNHVVTITRIERGTPIKIYVANQWGLKSDHTTPETAIDADRMIANMTDRQVVNGQTRVDAGMVLAPGDHTKGFRIQDGRIVEDELFSRSVARASQETPD